MGNLVSNLSGRGLHCLVVWGARAIHVALRWVLFALSEGREAEGRGVSTADLIQRFQDGQSRAFEALYNRYKDYVYRVAFYVTRHADEAEDATQEAFLDVLKALPHYDIEGPARFETWLYRVTVNRCRMRMRRKRPHAPEWGEIEERLVRMPNPNSVQPEAVALRRERAGALWQAVDRLPEPHRLVVLLRYQQDFSYQEIAETLSISLGTVKSRLYNAHKKLEGLLAA